MYFRRTKDEWTRLVEQADPLIRVKAAEIAVAHAHYPSIEFYRIVRIDPHAEEFSSNEQVERQLRSAMKRWIINVFSAQVSDVERLIQIQYTVAEVHARIGILVGIVEMGFRVLERILYLVIFFSNHPAAEKLQVCHFSINGIDIAMEVMTCVFIFSDSSASKEDENYRIFLLLESAEEEKERQIASILSWEIGIIYKILLDSDLGSSLPLSQVDFGPWFNHKGRHYFSGTAEVGHISRLIQDSDGIFNQTICNIRNLNSRSLRVKFLLQIRNTVLQIIILLRELFEEVSCHEVGMDVSTKLLSRRFLPTIFRREIAHANRTGILLLVLITDVDKSKEINDTWGRNTGDEILRKASRAFYDNVRSSDYAFRYGGDEFIIALIETSENETLRIAERIHSRVEKTKLEATNGEDTALPLFIDATIFNGHSDYERLIQIADEASYITERRGRSRVRFWKASLQMCQDAEVIIKPADAGNAADGIFFPAPEQNMMGVVLTNGDDGVMFFNPATEKLRGYKREEVIGNNADMLIPRDLRPAYPEYIHHSCEGDKARVEGMSRELQLKKKDGSKIWTRLALSKVSAGGKVYYLALVRDASVEMARKEQTRQLTTAAGRFDRPVIVPDPERHIVQCNRAFTEMSGYCISEASGMQPDTLLNIPEFPAGSRIRLQQLLWKTARDQDEFLLLMRTDEKIWIKVSISPAYDVLAHLQNLVMTLSDTTEERQIRQPEGNILAVMYGSPPFHEMGEIIRRNIESISNESHVSLLALRNRMPIHWASSPHSVEVQSV